MLQHQLHDSHKLTLVGDGLSGPSPQAYNDIIAIRERFIMSEESVETIEKPAPKARKPRAKKVAAETPVIENVEVAEAKETTNDEGQKVISGPKRSRAPRMSNIHAKDQEGTIASHAADFALAKKVVAEKKTETEVEKIALWSDRNIRWTNVGELSKGYNIVTKEAAEKWLGKRGIREATPQEVAAHYGK